MQLGLGEMGLTPAVFWDMNPREFWNARSGFFELEQTRERRELVRMRTLAYFCLTPYAKPNSGFKPSDLIQWDWEEETKTPIEPPTIEDFERVKAKYGLK